MSLLSNATPAPAAETPAKDGAPPDPKGPAVADAKSSPGDGSTANPSESGGASEKQTPPAPAKAQQDFEAKLEELATLDLSVKEQAKEIAKAKARLDRYTPLDEHLSKGELKAAAKKFFGDEYTAELLLELADDFAPEEVSVEERVKRTLEAEKKAQEEVDKKKKDEKTASDQAAVETETKAYLTATANHLRANKVKFPLMVAWDDDPDIDHEAMIDKAWRDHYARTNEVPSPDKVLETIETRHMARIKKTKFGPQEHRERTLEEHAGNAPAPEPVRPLVPAVDNRPVTGADEARARLEAYDKEQRQREMLSYGR